MAARIHAGPRFDLDVREPGLAIQLRQAPPDIRVSAVAGEGDGEDLAQPVERRVGWVADSSLGIRLKARS